MVGYLRIGFDPAIAAWARAARLDCWARVAGEERRSGGTWAVGLEALANRPDGAVGGMSFPWEAVGLTPVPLHRGQVSTVYPGYPQPSAQESEAAFGFRVRRDGAHVDGILAVGPDKRRMVKEPHAWILGMALNEAEASPLVVWEGSHEVMRAGLAQAFVGQVGPWDEVEVTAAYKVARARVFETCRRVELPGRVGEAVLLHRLTLHGVAPWEAGAKAPPEGRMVAYFRPVLGSVQAWISQD